MGGIDAAAKDSSVGDILGVINLTAPVQSFGQLLTLLRCNDFLLQEYDLEKVFNDRD